jgi:hypothetical protein
VEYQAIASTISELVWIKQLLEDLGINIETPMKIYYDNQVIRHIASNPIFHERIKHIKVDYHFIREKNDPTKSKLNLLRAKINSLTYSLKALTHDHSTTILTS